MARFDVHETREGALVVLCQSALLDHLDVRFAMPLIEPRMAPAAANRLNPTVQIDGQIFLAFPQWSSGMPLGSLGRKVGNVEDQSFAILGAFDFLMSGI